MYLRNILNIKGNRIDFKFCLLNYLQLKEFTDIKFYYAEGDMN